MTMEAQIDWQIGKSLSDRMKYMLDNQLMCDVTLHVGSDKSTIKAHKYMLAIASPVFYRMFEGPLSEKGDVDIVDITPAHFNMMLHVDKDHACTVFQTAHDFHMTDLKEEALDFIFKNGSASLVSDDFLYLSGDCLKLILESDQLYCDETTIYQRMVQWAKLQCEEQSMPTFDENVRKTLGDLIYLIRFPIMTPKYFTNEVSSQEILTDKEKVGVYEHFNGKQTDIFISKHRKEHIHNEIYEEDAEQYGEDDVQYEEDAEQYGEDDVQYEEDAERW
ncbi:Hypothetical predicted protein [Mytilus galloprovincialis]|uniref:BTB domain-containing protein n=1 Tax=Mytilus galloprovincialis TaxID=29158 RepID=A0A8B6FYE8_MYTGA|nr:Hypothetical predicted protein [Mytilus galloprovincialis]